MDNLNAKINIGNCVRHNPDTAVSGEYVTTLGEQYFCIRHYDQMPPFFMSIVSSADHWIFISSTGGISAGRSNAESALFPYYTDDRIAENQSNTGHLAVLIVKRNDHSQLWEPLSAHDAGLYNIERSLYKNGLGDKLIFEEINHDLGLTYRYAWRTSDKYGFIKTMWLVNNSAEHCEVNILDGVQNLLPFGTTTAMQTTFSNLLNAYKRNELEPQSGLGMFSLSSTLSDLAEPSESLKTTTVWQVGLDKPSHLLSTLQLENFRRGLEIDEETDICGYRGAYLVNATVSLAAGEQKEWSIVADVNQDSLSVTSIISKLKQDAGGLKAALEDDISQGSANLWSIVASADGLQLSGEHLTTSHHFSNVLFNTMRGGIFANQYKVGKADLFDFISVRNKEVANSFSDFFASLPDEIDTDDLIERATARGSSDLQRLCYEYLPLTFGRRHGDPSRPWNRFSINIKKPDGSQRLDYQGNWRDIFQNWEPLAWSYPEYAEKMISVFLNATTVDGYNPYRVTREGIEWETPAPHDPWANIGYWSDHQIIYLEKLLEVSAKFHPGQLESLMSQKVFSYANVPYHIKEYTALIEDPHNTIDFDWELENKIEARVQKIGSDGKLLQDAQGKVLHVNMSEKLLVLLLAKLGNFVPEGGIWMNTQRPEWNDANNALVGKGLSVVTLCYLRRYVEFYQRLLANTGSDILSISREVENLFDAMRGILEDYKENLASSFSDEQRRLLMDALGRESSDYRWYCYQQGLSGEFKELDKNSLLAFLGLVQQYIEHTLRANKRPDDLYHAYNILHLSEGRAAIGNLYEMLEGQVAILSSGMLTVEQSLGLLRSLRNSSMYRADQHSYMLYPNRQLKGFLKKNQVSPEQVQGLALIAKLVEDGDKTIIARDLNGICHFNGSFRNAKDLKRALDNLAQNKKYAQLVAAETMKILDLFEAAFDHNSFTGRSGTFYAYEGLGSIYWHMVSKLLLATQEAFLRAVEDGSSQQNIQALSAAYYDIRKGLGFNKAVEVYGAFPTDPYSHTPIGQGAKQPGMTGQVKEEILTRFAELGLFVEEGRLLFNPVLLKEHEFIAQPSSFDYVDVHGLKRTLNLPAASLAYTFCQVPVIYQCESARKIVVSSADGKIVNIDGSVLDAETSRHIFRRDGTIQSLTVYL